MNKSDIGVIGMAVMGKNLALNFADHGYRVSIYNRTTAVARAVVTEHQHENIVFNETLEAFVASLKQPRKILIMVQAGPAVDAVIEQVLEFVEQDDILIDGGNSYFEDTQRRYFYLKEKGVAFLGLGVSGGEEGARLGPALMPSGDREVYDQVGAMLDAIAARAHGEACAPYIGKEGSGHFVKMVHNGIEYGDMQLIREAYTLLKDAMHLSADAIAGVFDAWNDGELNSYLIEITATIVNFKDPLSEGLLLDKIVDVAKQKGTGKWTSRQSLELNVDASVLTSAIYGRIMSENLDLRAKADAAFGGLKKKQTLNKEWITKIEHALYVAKIMAYAQGFDLLNKANLSYVWDLNMADIAKGWRAGCIIRAKFLDTIADAYHDNPMLEHLLFDAYFETKVREYIDDLRDVVTFALANGYPVNAFANAITYFDAFTTEQSYASLIQAQRDFFGAHSFKRIDQEGDFHGGW